MSAIPTAGRHHEWSDKARAAYRTAQITSDFARWRTSRRRGSGASARHRVTTRLKEATITTGVHGCPRPINASKALALTRRSRTIVTAKGITRAQASLGERSCLWAQQPVASRMVRHACVMRRGESCVTKRRKAERGTVWMLSKLTTQSLGTPSWAAVSTSSETKPRSVLVKAATTTDPIRSATGSRVTTSTGRSPPGVAVNQISPRCIGPV